VFLYLVRLDCPLSRIERRPVNRGSKCIVLVVKSVGAGAHVHYTEVSVIRNVCYWRFHCIELASGKKGVLSSNDVLLY